MLLRHYMWLPVCQWDINPAKKPNAIIMSWNYLKNAPEEAIHANLLQEMVHIQMYSQGRWGEGRGRRFTFKLQQIDREWRRESGSISPDEMLMRSGSLSSSQITQSYLKRQFPTILNSESLRAKAVNKPGYRYVRWK